MVSEPAVAIEAYLPEHPAAACQPRTGWLHTLDSWLSWRGAVNDLLEPGVIRTPDCQLSLKAGNEEALVFE